MFEYEEINVEALDAVLTALLGPQGCATIRQAYQFADGLLAAGAARGFDEGYQNGFEQGKFMGYADRYADENREAIVAAEQALYADEAFVEPGDAHFEAYSDELSSGFDFIVTPITDPARLLPAPQRVDANGLFVAEDFREGRSS